MASGPSMTLPVIVTDGGSVPQSAEGAQQVLGVGFATTEPIFNGADEVESLGPEPPHALSKTMPNTPKYRDARAQRVLIELKTDIENPIL